MIERRQSRPALRLGALGSRRSMIALGLRGVGGAAMCLALAASGAAQAPRPDTVANVAPGGDAKAAAASGEARVDRLIRQLGADEYATRERAQAELDRLGLSAFDALDQAQSHEDIEVALRARYLLRSMAIPWVGDNDPPDVRAILRNYDRSAEAERINRMEKLAALPDWQGLPALCRVVRFEREQRLAKVAALLVMSQAAPDEAARRRVLAGQIEQGAGDSPRSAVEWVRTYAASLIDPQATVSRWEELTSAEERRLAERADPQDSRLVRNLLRWQADFLRGLDRQEEALAVMRRTVAVHGDDREEVIDSVDWLIERQAWPVIEELAAKYPVRFAEDPSLTYRLAEAQRKRGAVELAEATALQASQMQGVTPPQRYKLARILQIRELYDWSERECRLALDNVAVVSEESLSVRNFLAEMLHDLQRDLEAAQVLQGLVDVLDRDARASEQVEGPGRREASWPRARMHYFYGVHFGRSGDLNQQAEHLKKATEFDPSELDALIARHRYSQATAEWTAETRRLIEAAAAQLSQQIDELRKHAGEPGEQGAQAYANTEMARHCNHYAWLVSNTVGDYQKALDLALEANRRAPNTAAYLDTLGRSYYAVGDLENAVKFQARAVELEPYYQQIRRQLEFFQEELAKARQGASSKPAP